MSNWKPGDGTNEILKKILDALTGGATSALSVELSSDRVGGYSTTVLSGSAVSVAAYAAGEIVGPTRVLAVARLDGGGAILQDVVVTDLSNQKAEFNLYFFNADPAASAISDGATFGIHANDIDKLIGIVNIAADEYIDLTTHAVAAKNGIGLVLKPASGLNIYCVAVTAGTPDYVAAGDLAFQFGILQD